MTCPPNCYFVSSLNHVATSTCLETCISDQQQKEKSVVAVGSSDRRFIYGIIQYKRIGFFALNMTDDHIKLDCYTAKSVYVLNE